MYLKNSKYFVLFVCRFGRLDTYYLVATTVLYTLDGKNACMVIVCNKNQIKSLILKSSILFFVFHLTNVFSSKGDKHIEHFSLSKFSLIAENL